jgi:hypothetical protein
MIRSFRDEQTEHLFRRLPVKKLAHYDLEVEKERLGDRLEREVLTRGNTGTGEGS